MVIQLQRFPLLYFRVKLSISDKRDLILLSLSIILRRRIGIDILYRLMSNPNTSMQLMISTMRLCHLAMIL